ncbi:YraN family protein [Caldalkalibacillus salinus]|uniref:YraN family protein n=1 Tax=Caldalkalibacillus salinus TaxID=2803787 RepID=UPI0019229FD6|nr:YraN family protein [Caldalkalibacillus salinus]
MSNVNGNVPRLDQRKKIGHYGEKLAMEAYEALGYQTIERQFRCRFGEIDLILRKDHTLYFVEVRTKTSLAFGTAEESVHRDKQQTIRRVSECYLQQYSNQKHDAVQFDVVCIYINKRKRTAQLYRYEQAF